MMDAIESLIAKDARMMDRVNELNQANKESDSLKEEIIKHLDSLENGYFFVGNIVEFRWLYRAIVYWESYLLYMFNTVINVPIPRPNNLTAFPHSPTHFFPYRSDDQIEAEQKENEGKDKKNNHHEIDARGESQKEFPFAD